MKASEWHTEIKRDKGLETLELRGLFRNLTTSKCEEIKAGDATHIGTNDHGEYTIWLADSNRPANSQAVEDLIGPDVYWNQKTGEVFNA